MPDTKKKKVAVVGARNADHAGVEISKKLSKGMADYGIDVISGLAYGIDSAAHTGALSSLNGETYAILGCGVDICYPRKNMEIYREIVLRGEIISEYPPGAEPKAGYFPMRNRIISGIADAVLIVEAGEKSGSLITANLALEQGKDVFVVPGDINSLLYKGSNKLIKEGANVVTCIKDIMDGLGLFYDDDIDDFKNKNLTHLSQNERMIYECLNLNPVHITQLSYATGLEIKDVINIITNLVLKGLVKEIGVNYYAVML
jgi:DNA processing protein